MTLSDEARGRLADVVELQPTKNGELQERWGVDSGSEVHQYLENELKEYYYRNEDSLICATPEAAELVDVEPGIVAGEDGTTTAVRVPELQARVVEVVPASDEDGMSVVAVLHALRDAYDVDTDTDEVRSALQALKRKGVVEVVYTTVPTFRLAVDRDALDVAVSERDEGDDGSDASDASNETHEGEGGEDGDIMDDIEGEFEGVESDDS